MWVRVEDKRELVPSFGGTAGASPLSPPEREARFFLDWLGIDTSGPRLSYAMLRGIGG